MKNLADSIENFIISQLVATSHNMLLVQRNELADRLSCAPSQVSYVLSTRFTPERGYYVESRRGSGGFVRIVRVHPGTENVQKEEPTASELLEYWVRNRFISKREYMLLDYMINALDASEDDKLLLVKNAVQRVLNER